MKRVVVKLGTGILARPAGQSLDLKQFRRLAADFANLIQKGLSLIVVSSGAVTAGVSVMRLDGRPTDLAGKQACAAAGQPLLMRTFDVCLRRHGVHAAQLLLTHDDIDSRRRRQNARNTLERLLSTPRVLPIINENDSVAVEELNFGDNDRLSAEVAVLAEADLLVILTSSDGLLNDKVRIPEVSDIDAAFSVVTAEKGPHSTGGMGAKLTAVKIALANGIETVIADGRKADQLAAAVERQDVGTRFLAPSSRQNPS